ncbi:MAG: hypothetical protein CME62_03765 [Halobacteriovoraceae bacterium]|nr:hypothetical protein [Halobacteriovoraceae bacterium]|tara:strand:- start:4283 stop:5098 length:816 start_codon:yes stop_codon:yes gene_type:complete
MSPFFNFLIRSNFYIAGSSFFLTFYYQFLINQTFDLSSFFLNFCLVYLAYNLLRFKPIFQKQGLKTPQEVWFRKHSLFVYLSSTLCSLFVLLQLHSFTYIQLGILGLTSVITLVYGKFILAQNKLREISILKPLLIGLSWALICVALPAKTFDRTFFILFSECIIFITCLSILYDFKDLSFDRSLGVKTLAARYQHSKIFMVSIFCVMTIASVMLTILLKSNLLMPLIFLLILYGFNLSIFLKKKLTEMKLHFWVDGLIYLKSVSLILLLF